jgi:hypothetical protein
MDERGERGDKKGRMRKGDCVRSIEIKICCSSSLAKWLRLRQPATGGTKQVWTIIINAGLVPREDAFSINLVTASSWLEWGLSVAC